MNKKIFIYRKGALGDTLSFLPFLFALRKRYSSITFAGNYLYRQIFENIDFINFLDADSRDVLNILLNDDVENETVFDEVLLFTKQFELGKALTKAKFFPPLPDNSWFYSHPFDCTGMSFKQEKIYLPVCYYEDIEKIVGSNRYAVFHTGSGGRSKRLPLNIFFQLEKFLKELDFEVIYLIGEAELELLNSLKNKKVLVNQPLNKVIFLMSRCFFYVGCDSGISHLAGVLNLCGVVIFGPSDPFIYKPWGELTVLKSKADFSDVDYRQISKILGDEFEKRRDLFSF